MQRAAARFRRTLNRLLIAGAACAFVAACGPQAENVGPASEPAPGETAGPEEAPAESPTLTEADPTVGEGRAVLRSGPTIGRGIDFLPANVVEYQRADYLIAEGPVVIHYFQVDGELWEVASTYRCGTEPMAQIESADAHLRALDDGYLFFQFPESLADPCTFVTPFLRDLRFFQRASRGDPQVPFPAFVDLDR